MTDSIGRGLADGHDPARRDDARALRRDVHERGRPPGAAVHDPPGAVRQLRAVHRDPDRALRRRVPALARARCRRSCCRSATRQRAYAEQVRDALLAAGLRATIDERDEKVGRKIRDAEEQKVPAMLVVGEREAEAGEVSLRRHGRRNLGRASARDGGRGARRRERGALARRSRERAGRVLSLSAVVRVVGWW